MTLRNLFARRAPVAQTHRLSGRQTPGRVRLCLETLESRYVPVTVTWINPVGGLWHVGSNWDTSAAPGAGDDAVIPDVAGHVAITHSQGTNAIRSLTSAEAVILSGGSLELTAASTIQSALILDSGATLTGAGNLTVNGRFTWSSGTMAGTGATTANGGILWNGFGATLSRTLNHSGSATLSGPNSSLTIATGGVFNNQAGAVFDITNNQSVFGAGIFNNLAAAAFRRTVSPDAVAVQPRFNNGGTVSVRTGTLNLTGGGSHTGLFDGSLDGALGFGGGTHTLAAGSAVTTPDVVFRGGTVTVAGRYEVLLGTTVSGATVTFTAAADLRSIGQALTVEAGTLSCNSGEALAPVLLRLYGGTLTGASNITATTILWAGGTMSGSGTTTVSIAVEFNGGATILGRTLNVDGRTQMLSQNAALAISLGAVFNNRLGATFFLGNSQGLFSQGTFNNQAGASFVRLGDSGTATVQPVFNNAGEVRVDSGTLNFTGGGNHLGRFTGLAGTTLQFGGGAHEFQNASRVDAAHVVFSSDTANVSGTYSAAAGSTFSGATVTFNPAATLSAVGSTLTGSSGIVTLNSGEALTVTSLVLTGGTLTGSDNLTVTGPLTWRGGTLSGTGATTADEYSSLSGSSMTLGRTFNNRRYAVLEGASSSLTLLTGAVWNNDGVLEILNARGFFGGTGTVNNPGYIAVTNAATFQTALNNGGYVYVVYGRLTLTGGGNHTGTFFDASEGTLVFNGGAHDFQSTAYLAFRSVIFDSGTVNMNGTYYAPGSTVFRGAVVTFNPGTVVYSLGADLAVLSGTVRLNSGAALFPSTLFLVSGTLTGSDSMTVVGRLTWWGGTLSGTGTTTVTDGIDFSGSNMTLGRVLTNLGTATWTGAGGIFVTPDGVFNNNGTFDVQNDQSFTSTSCLGTFNNAGLFQKTGSYGTTTMGVVFNNTGTVDVQTGTVTFPCGGAPVGGAPRGKQPGPDTLAHDLVLTQLRDEGRMAFAAPQILAERAMPAFMMTPLDYLFVSTDGLHEVGTFDERPDEGTVGSLPSLETGLFRDPFEASGVA